VGAAAGLPSVQRFSAQTPAAYVTSLKHAYENKAAEEQRQLAANAEAVRQREAAEAKERARTTTTATGPTNSPPDIGGFCKAHGSQNAVNINNTGYGWRCSPGNLAISATQMCHEQFGPTAVAMLATPAPGRPNDWYCRH